MTFCERIYHSESYCREFEAQILEIRSMENGMAALLDRTAFYPESGGQPFDLGKIDDVAITAVQQNEKGEILHYYHGQLMANSRVHCALDWERRFDHMQQHTGQHLLSEIFLREIQASTLSFHLGRESSTIDIDIPEIGLEQVRQIERQAQSAIYRNLLVKTLVVSSQEASRLPLRKPTHREGSIRVIEIDGMDWSACGGTHVQALGELGTIVIHQTERYKGGTRVEFLCGWRAFSFGIRQRQILRELSSRLSSSLAEMPLAVDRLLEENHRTQLKLKDYREQLQSLQAEALWACAEKTEAGRVIRSLVEVASPEEAKFLAATLLKKGACLAILAGKGGIGFAVAASSMPCLQELGKTFSQVITRYGGRGGGRGPIAQGGGFPPDQAELFLKDLQEALTSMIPV